MKNTILSLFCCLFLLSLSCKTKKNIQTSKQQENSVNEVRLALDSILSIAQSQSINTAAIANWEELKKEVHQKLVRTDSMIGLQEPVQFLLTALDDHHGSIYINNRPYGANIGVDESLHFERDIKIAKPIFQKAYSGVYEVNGQMIENIAYLEIPAIVFGTDHSTENINKAAQSIRTKICELASKNPEGWIIDLRRNIGGNMYSMVAGIGLLFPNADLGGSTNNPVDIKDKWETRNGNFYMSNTAMTNLEMMCTVDMKNSKVVALISRYTQSSGEAVATALKGQDNTTIIGELTSGYSSSNAWFEINDKVIFSPAISYYISKDKSFHRNGVAPDLEIVEALTEHMEMTQGKMIDEAMKLIKVKK